MKFIKENFHDIVRLVLNQIALAVFGLVLVSAARMANDGQIGVLALCASILSILFYMYILYATLQETGSKHRVRVDGGRMKRDNLWGMKVMAVAQIPNLILIVLLYIGLFLSFSSGPAGDVGTGIHGIVQLIIYVFQAPFNGLIGFISGTDVTTKTMVIVTVGYTLSVIPGLLVCWGSYVMGLHDKKLSSLFTRKPVDLSVDKDSENDDSHS